MLFTSAFTSPAGKQAGRAADEARGIADQVREIVVAAGGSGAETVDLTAYLTDPSRDAGAVRKALTEGLGASLGSLSEVPCARLWVRGRTLAVAAVAPLGSRGAEQGLHRLAPVTDAFPRSGAALVRGGRLVFVAGQVAGCGTDGGGDIARQTARAYENVRDVIEAAGATPASVVKETIWTLDIARWVDEAAGVRSAFYGGAFPAAAAVEISALSAPEQLVEIEVIAVA
jgi:enamine deaminase RidA (YjgF/YER057c/UK114 family)